MPRAFADAQSALSFVIERGRNIEAEVYRIRYPDINYGMHVPIVIEGNEWAIGTRFETIDYTGKAAFLNGTANDIPMNSSTRGEGTHDYALIGAGWEWTLEQINQDMLNGSNKMQEDAMAASKNTERLLYDIAMEGSTEKNWKGLVNDTNVSRTDVASTGTSSSTLWVNKSDDNILKDVNDLMSSIPKNSKEVEMVPNALRLPPEAFRAISVRKFGNGNGTLTLLEFLRRNNVYTAETGLPLDIMPLRALAKASQDSAGRMIAYTKETRVLRFHLPMPRRNIAPLQKGLMKYEAAVIARTGGTEVRVPGAMAYGDEIAAAPA